MTSTEKKKEKMFVFPSYLFIIEQELVLYYWANISDSLKWEQLNMKILIIYECINASLYIY